MENGTQQFNPFHGTAQEHLDWCVYRAMEYADAGDMAGAWASFASDVTKHDGTAHIARHEFFALTMLGGFENTPAKLRKFFSGWAVSQS